MTNVRCDNYNVSRSRSRSRDKTFIYKPSHQNDLGEAGKVRLSARNEQEKDENEKFYEERKFTFPLHLLESHELSFKDFMLIQPETIEAEDAFNEYEMYKEERNLFHSLNFFKSFKSSGLLIDKYHPNAILRNNEQQIKTAKFYAKQFLNDYQNLGFSGIKFSLSTRNISNEQKNNSNACCFEKVKLNINDAFLYEDEEILKIRKEKNINLLAEEEKNVPHFYIFHPAVNSVVFRNVPHGVLKWDVHDALQEEKGLLCVQVSHVKYNNVIQRNVVCTFQDKTSCNTAVSNLRQKIKFVKGFKLEPFPVESLNEIFDNFVFDVYLIPKCFSSNEQIACDLERTKNLILKFDKEREVHEDKEISVFKHPLFDLIYDNQAHTITEMLDIQILYLRRVHNVCYYSGERYLDSMQAWEECGSLYLRQNVMNLDEEYKLSEKEKNFLQKFEKKINELLSLDFIVPAQINENSPDIEKRWKEYCDENTVKVEEERYRCHLCRKLFKAEWYVHKHLKNRHAEILNDLIQQACEKYMCESYLADNRKARETKNIKSTSFVQDLVRSNSFSATNTMYSVASDASFMPFSFSHISSSPLSYSSYASFSSNVNLYDNVNLDMQNVHTCDAINNNVVSESSNAHYNQYYPSTNSHPSYSSASQNISPYQYPPPPPHINLNANSYVHINAHQSHVNHFRPNSFQNINTKGRNKPYVDLDNPKKDNKNDKETIAARCAVSYDDL